MNADNTKTGIEDPPLLPLIFHRRLSAFICG